MKEPLVSVIVLAYKVERYLSDCVESIRSQTYRNLEIILVDDGSPDACPQMCDAFAREDARIHVVHQENKGLAAARNEGLDQSTGEYITFVDGDDFIHESFVEDLLKACHGQNAEIAVSGFERVPQDITIKDKISGKELAGTYRCISGRDANLLIYKMDTWTRMTTAWGKLYRRSLFSQERYPDVRIHEDEAVTYRLLYRSSKVVLVDLPLYFYRINPESLTGQSFSEKQMSVFPIMEERAHFYEARGEEELLQQTYRREFYLATRYYSIASRTPQDSALRQQLRTVQKRMYQVVLKNHPGILRAVKYTMMILRPSGDF